MQQRITRFCLSIYTLNEHKSEIDCKHHPFRSHFPIDGIAFQLNPVAVQYPFNQSHCLASAVSIEKCCLSNHTLCANAIYNPMRIRSIRFKWKEAHSNPPKRIHCMAQWRTAQVGICSWLKFLINIYLNGIKSVDKCLWRPFTWSRWLVRHPRIYQLLESPFDGSMCERLHNKGANKMMTFRIVGIHLNGGDATNDRQKADAMKRQHRFEWMTKISMRFPLLRFGTTNIFRVKH